MLPETISIVRNNAELIANTDYTYVVTNDYLTGSSSATLTINASAVTDNITITLQSLVTYTISISSLDSFYKLSKFTFDVRQDCSQLTVPPAIAFTSNELTIVYIPDGYDFSIVRSSSATSTTINFKNSPTPIVTTIKETVNNFPQEVYQFKDIRENISITIQTAYAGGGGGV